VSQLFNLLTGYSRLSTYEMMMVAPMCLRERMLGAIAHQAELAAAGKPSGVTMKLNGLVDEAIIDGLYAASQAGVPIDIVVRGICALRPGVKRLSEGIRVRSILGRFLEHSRIYRFGAGDDDEIWIGSADMMHRNLDRRVEAVALVADPALRARLRGVLELALADRGAWELGADGKWTRGKGGGRVPGLQEALIAAARRGALTR
jgi:polyphosphate kinase